MATLIVAIIVLALAVAASLPWSYWLDRRIMKDLDKQLAEDRRKKRSR
jgi:type II secretory pathway pseudopilin PulG